jgi:crotonobetainyl-CoA:carnitine CoA-transferase CaiB-like acyl-CoA transferase
VLSGIRVFDMTLAAVGPWASKLLGQLGADVIKVESPEPEMAHQIPPRIRGTGVLYISANFNKRQIVLDLKDDADREAAYRLAACCDVFIQNMRPGAAEKLGFGYDDVVAVRPDVVYVTASAYGRVGPMSSEGGVDPLLQAFCGWTSITGPPGSEGEMFRHFAHLDITTSSNIVDAVLQALVHRERTGEGQHIEIEMLTAAIALQSTRLGEFLLTGEQPPPLGSAVTTSVPHQAFECQDREWLAVGVTRDDEWPRCCAALGLDDLATDTRFATNADRVRRRDELVPVLAERFASKPIAWWAHRLTAARVANSRIMDFDVLRHHPQVVANGHLAELDTPHFGRLVVDAVPWTFEATPAGPPVAGGLQGEHSDEVRAELGLDG